MSPDEGGDGGGGAQGADAGAAGSEGAVTVAPAVEGAARGPLRDHVDGA